MFSLLSWIGLGLLAIVGSLLSMYNVVQAARKSQIYLIRSVVCLVLFLVSLAAGILINT